jgi:primosomal protein N' (replication factor Y)
VLTKNWYKFYNEELAERRRFNFPPFCYLLTIGCRRGTRLRAEVAASALAKKMIAENPEVLVEGPAPSFREKNKDSYQWQIIVKARKRQDLLNIIANLPSNYSYNIDPLDLL